MFLRVIQAATRPDNRIRIIDINRDNYTDRSLTVPRSNYDLPLKPIIGDFHSVPINTKLKSGLGTPLTQVFIIGSTFPIVQ